MRRNTTLGHSVHTLGANLNLYPTTLTSRNSCMQRLVAILFGNSYPITHTIGVRCIAIAHDRIYRPAELLLHLALTVDNHTQGKDIVNTFKRHVLFAHLVPDRVDGLGAALNVVLNALTVDSRDNRN